MRKNRTEIWGGCAKNFYFKPIDNVGEFAIKTYRSEKQAHTCSSWDRDFEVVPITETIISTDHLANNPFEWISVDDRLPKGANGKDLTENVIVYTVDHKVGTGWLTEDKWWLLLVENDTHFAFGVGYVTHWMPLPEAPKGSDTNE